MGEMNCLHAVETPPQQQLASNNQAKNAWFEMTLYVILRSIAA